jgi:capsular polysaccharide transport system permease protein
MTEAKAKTTPETLAPLPRPARSPKRRQLELIAQAAPAPSSPPRPPRSPKRRQLDLIARSGSGSEMTPEIATETGAAAPAAPEIVRAARLQPRHWALIASFVLIVLAPLAIATYYLFARASDQYHSEVSFSVRSEELASATAGLIGALTQVGGGTSDADILYEYIRSQQIVASIDPSLDLRAIWNRAENDPYFTLGDDSTIEALHAQWNRMVGVAYDAGTGIIHIQVRAFRPEDATAIATAILARSDALVNTLSEQARKDAVRFANEELADAEANLRDVRDRVATFRRDYNLVDPQADVAGQMGLLNALQAELAQALVDRDVLTSYAAEGDQRVVQADRRIAAITKRLEDERGSLSVAGVGASLPEVIGRYEELLVDLEFASTAYTQALGGVTAARAEARRQSRYLAAHIQPSAAESSLYPRRAMLAGLTGLFLLLGWGVLALFYYNVRDDR